MCVYRNKVQRSVNTVCTIIKFVCVCTTSSLYRVRVAGTDHSWGSFAVVLTLYLQLSNHNCVDRLGVSIFVSYDTCSAVVMRFREAQLVRIKLKCIRIIQEAISPIEAEN